MDAYEATRIVFSRIQSLDPENASKIMGLLLIQDHGEKEMIRLAFGPEALLHSVVLKARNELGLSTNTPSTPSTPSSPSPFFSSNNNNNNSTATNPISISRQNSASFPPSRMLNPNPSLSMSSSSSWAPSTFSDLQHPDDLNLNSSNTYAAAAAAAAINGFSNNNMAMGSSSSSDLIDEFQLQDQLSFLNDHHLHHQHHHHPKNNNSSDLFYPQPESVSSPNSNTTDGMLFPSYSANWGGANGGVGNHRRSCSVTDICLGSSDPLGSGLGWKPCLYYARGYCKNGTSCRFLHGLPDDPSTAMVGSPTGANKLDVMEQCQELLLRSKAQQQQQQQNQLRLNTASQLMSSSAFPYSPTSAAGKCMNFLLQQQQSDQQRAAAAALMLGEDVHKFSRARMERNDFCSTVGGGMVNPGSRQIYLTFPADSTFREEDVSNYFSIYGPVQDVRIPYQQKRMFGFVTFVYPETVKLILAKGNPHFVCDARVLVKPYKEKGKVPEKKQHQQMERGDYSPTGLDSRDPFDLQLGGRMFNSSTQDLLLRRKLEEQVELQHALELQGRRLMGLQLLDVKKHHHHHRNLSAGAAPIPSPTYPHSPYMNNHHHTFMSDRSSPEFPEENGGNPASAGDQQLQKQTPNLNGGKEECYGDEHDNGSGNGNGNENGNGSDGKESPKNDESCNLFHDSLEHNLPDSPFASPIKSGGDPPPFFISTSSVDTEKIAVTAAALSSSSSSSSNANNNMAAASPMLPASSTLDMASLKSCFFQIPRFSSGHGALGM